MRLAWTRLALADVASVRAYLAERSPSAVGPVIERIRTAAAALARHPELGRRGRIDDTRELVVSGTPLIVPYRVKKDRIELLAVIHSARRWPEAI